MVTTILGDLNAFNRHILSKKMKNHVWSHTAAPPSFTLFFLFVLSLTQFLYLSHTFLSLRFLLATSVYSATSVSVYENQHITTVKYTSSCKLLNI